MLPVFDPKIYESTLPEGTNNYLFEELDHIDFQSNREELDSDPDEDEFSPQAEVFDETNRSFCQSRFASHKINKTPLASMRLCDLSSKLNVGTKDETLFFYGSAQWDLAFFAEELSIEQHNRNSAKMRRYFKSSTPLTLVIDFLSSFRKKKTMNVSP